MILLRYIIYDANDSQNGEGQRFLSRSCPNALVQEWGGWAGRHPPIYLINLTFKAPPCYESLLIHWRLHRPALLDGCSIGCTATTAAYLLGGVHPNADPANTD